MARRSPDVALAHRAAIHAALGEPGRLGIVDDLTTSDRSPAELARRHGLTSNLLAHHLDVLEAAGVITRSPSSGDGRRKYVRLVGSALWGLVPVLDPPTSRVVFLCTHNSARSQLAAAMWSSRSGVPAESAGTHPAAHVHPGALAAARRAGLDLSGAEPRLVGALADDVQVVTVCDRAHEELAAPPSWWHWSIPDPVEIGTDAAFDAVVAELDARMHVLVHVPEAHPS